MATPIQIPPFIQGNFGKVNTTYKASDIDQIVLDAANNAINTANTNTASAVAGAFNSSVQIIDGSSNYTIQDSNGPILVIVNAAALIPALQIKMPPNLKDGQQITIVFGGTLATLVPVVTAFSLAANGTGWSIYQQTTPDQPVGGDVVSLRASTTLKKVFRII